MHWQQSFNNGLIKKFRSFQNAYPYFVDVFLFAIITLLLHWFWWNVVWKAETFNFLHLWAENLAHWVFVISSGVLEYVLSFEHSTAGNVLYFSNGYISVEPSCSGLKQFYQLGFLLLLFPGPWKHKLWYIPAGLILIFIVNVFRIIALSYVLKCCPAYWDFAHLWILRPFYYVVIFVLWIIWVEHFKKSDNQKEVKH